MKLLFVDTAGWVSAADRKDRYNAESCRMRDQWLSSGGFLVTSDYVIDETLTVIMRNMGMLAAERWWEQVDASKKLKIEQVDATRQGKARSFFFRYHDQGFSFTDCTSFVIMKEKGIQTVLTLDRHFLVAGFTVVPDF